jgi:signal transduction histidine kinase
MAVLHDRQADRPNGQGEARGALSRAVPLRSLGPGVQAAVAAAAVLAFIALEWLSFIHEHKGIPSTPWNPGLGVAFALIMLARWPGIVALFAGVVIAEIFVLHTELQWPIIVAIGAIVAASYGLVAEVAQRRFALDVAMIHLRDVLVLLGAGFAGAAIVTTLLTAVLIATGPLVPDDVADASLPLLVGDMIGIAVITPLTLRIVHAGWPIARARIAARALEAAIFVAVILGGLWAIIASEGSDGAKYLYVFFVPIVAAALRHGLDGACLSLAATQLGLVALLHQYGYDAPAFTEFQLIMLALTATGLIVGVVVSERRNANRMMREAAQRLKAMEAESAQAARVSLVSGMASALAHEINQPMTAARALARSVQVLVEAPGPDLKRAHDNLTEMIAQIDHASGVVRRMREFLRRGRPHSSTVPVRAMLDEALTLARADAASQRVDLALDVPDGIPDIHGDRIQLQQVVLNLVRNAIEAVAQTAGRDGAVRVSARRDEAQRAVIISVADNGPGIDADFADRLFGPLTTTKRGGLGLGLAISASIVESHGGRIWLQSRAPGATEFRFSLPLDAAPSP